MGLAQTDEAYTGESFALFVVEGASAEQEKRLVRILVLICHISRVSTISLTALLDCETI